MGYRWENTKYGMRDVDHRAVAVGVVFQILIVAPLVYYSEPEGGLFFGAVFGGLLTGWLSRNFEGEYLDGMVAALLGLLVNGSLAIVAVYVLGGGLDASLIVMLMLFGAVMVGTPLIMLAGALGGFIGGNFRRVVAEAR